MMMTHPSNNANNVNGPSLTNGAGRDTQVIILRNPYRGYLTEVVRWSGHSCQASKSDSLTLCAIWQTLSVVILRPKSSSSLAVP